MPDIENASLMSGIFIHASTVSGVNLIRGPVVEMDRAPSKGCFLSRVRMQPEPNIAVLSAPAANCRVVGNPEATQKQGSGELVSSQTKRLRLALIGGGTPAAVLTPRDTGLIPYCPKISGNPFLLLPMTTTLAFELLARFSVASIPFHSSNCGLIPWATIC